MRHRVQDMGAALNQMYRRLDAHACEELIKSRPKPAPLRVLLAAFGCHALASAVGGGSRRSMLYAYHVAHPAGHMQAAQTHELKHRLPWQVPRGRAGVPLAHSSRVPGQMWCA